MDADVGTHGSCVRTHIRIGNGLRAFRTHGSCVRAHIRIGNGLRAFRTHGPCVPTFFIGKANLKKKAIPYIVANRYFLKNGVETLPPQKITNQKDFDSYFGTAAVMDENGNPTVINFSTQYVISLTRPETDIETRLVPKSLETNQKGEIVLCYQEIQGQKRTYTTQPLLLIIVDKKYDGNVVLSKVE